MAIALVSHVAKTTPGTSGAISTTGATLLVAAAGYTAASSIAFPNISDNQSNNWGLPYIPGNNGGSNTGTIALWFVSSPTTAASHTFTCGGSGFESLCVAAFSGTPTTFTVDSPGASSGATGTSLQAGSVTPSVDNSLLIAALAFRVAATVSIDSGFTITDQNPFSSGVAVGTALAYLIETSAAAQNPTWSWTGSAIANAILVSFRPLASTPVGRQRTFITSGTSWSGVATDGSDITVECIGGGGAGATAATNIGTGGGGGAYAIKTVAYASGSSVSGITIGQGGATSSADGTDTIWNTNVVIAKGGKGGPTATGAGGAGGAAASCTPSAGAYSGGAGGGTGTNSRAGGAGGGAGGPSGIGSAGGIGGAASVFSGAGGGGNGGGNTTAGGASSTGNGGTGGTAKDGTAGGAGGTGGASPTAGTNGTNGSGGGGGGGSATGTTSGAKGGDGGAGNEWDSTHGSGGGGGGGGGCNNGGTPGNGGAGGTYGAGGGGGGWTTTAKGTFGAGANGIIVITYNPPTGSGAGGAAPFLS